MYVCYSKKSQIQKRICNMKVNASELETFQCQQRKTQQLLNCFLRLQKEGFSALRPAPLFPTRSMWSDPKRVQKMGRLNYFPSSHG